MSERDAPLPGALLEMKVDLDERMDTMRAQKLLRARVNREMLDVPFQLCNDFIQRLELMRISTRVASDQKTGVKTGEPTIESSKVEEADGVPQDYEDSDTEESKESDVVEESGNARGSDFSEAEVSPPAWLGSEALNRMPVYIVLPDHAGDAPLPYFIDSDDEQDFIEDLRELLSSPNYTFTFKDVCHLVCTLGKHIGRNLRVLSSIYDDEDVSVTELRMAEDMIAQLMLMKTTLDEVEPRRTAEAIVVVKKCIEDYVDCVKPDEESDDEE